ncbi:LysR family transcriptional regulator [uncultured Mitsuokella sp.]|uniref:LysR family transcriptional regulator n=1 Tax=uncultured Mitsuokella sp. TaxID=453120 RepID=UPI00259A99B8|nr:LysR family transcriptional regulator [uncultured Mitsuokella sp.]
MELRVLKYFLAVARHRNITRAAEELHLTQPTLSRQLQDLEEELGTPLFTREKRRMELTEAGLFLKARAEEMTAIETKTLDQFAHLEDFIAGDVYLGCGETQAVRLVVQALTPLGRAYPQIHFHFVSGNDEQTFDALQKGVLDFGLLCQQTPPADFVYRQVPFDDEWGLYLRRDHPLAQKQAITPQELYEEQLILSRQLLRDHVFAHWLGKDPEELDIRATYNLVYNAAFLVEQRLGLLLSFKGLVPIEGPEHPDLTFRPFSPAFSSHNYLIWKKEQVFSRAAAIVRARLEEAFGHMTDG